MRFSSLAIVALASSMAVSAQECHDDGKICTTDADCCYACFVSMSLFCGLNWFIGLIM